MRSETFSAGPPLAVPQTGGSGPETIAWAWALSAESFAVSAYPAGTCRSVRFSVEMPLHRNARVGNDARIPLTRALALPDSDRVELAGELLARLDDSTSDSRD